MRSGLLALVVAVAAWPVRGQTLTPGLIRFTDNGAWCWYQDEKVVFDPAKATFHLSTTANVRGFRGTERNGNIEHVTLQLGTGHRTRTVLDHRPYLNGKGDDHNIGAIWIMAVRFAPAAMAARMSCRSVSASGLPFNSTVSVTEHPFPDRFAITDAASG